MDHSTTEWIGTEGVNLEGQFVLGAGSFPTFAPEKGPKAIFPCQGKEQMLYFGLIQVIQEIK